MPEFGDAGVRCLVTGRVLADPRFTSFRFPFGKVGGDARTPITRPHMVNTSNLSSPAGCR